MLKASGFDDEALSKPIIGVANTWIEIGPCNHHLRELAAAVKDGIRGAGGTPMEFNTVSINDGITMGTDGMRASLISREVIADSIELVTRGYNFDGVIALCGCDKTIPGTTMAVARLGIPGLVLYGGSIAPGVFKGRDVTIQDVFEAVGAHASGRMSDTDLHDIEDHACPGSGACGGQFTANTMATAIEFLGVAPMGSGSVPATAAEKGDVGRRAGALVMELVRGNVLPREILTREALENAIASVACTGGSTNAVLHLLAIAREVGVPLEMDDFDRISRGVPLLADLKPGGRYVATDLYHAGGIALVAKRLLEAGLLHADARTVSGRTIGEEAAAAVETPAQAVIRPLSNPLKATGGLVILRGNLAPEGCVVKVAGHDRLHHRGPARVFDSEQAALAAVLANQIQPNDVVVIRYEGPAGSPGMPEMLAVTGALVGQGAARGGPIAALREGDIVVFDVPSRRLDVELPGDELAARLQRWTPKAARYTRGVMAKYAQLVSSAAQGAVTS
jgi:dihydroxy-acid dehydratase